MPYAKSTRVPVAQTRGEIEKLVVDRHRATAFVAGFQADPPRATIQFGMRDRIVRFDLPLPVQARGQLPASHEQAKRARWRALLLIIKAKLEAVESGVTTFEEEFLAHVVLPGGRTVAQHVIPRLAKAYTSGHAPRLLAEFTGGEE